MSSRQVIHATVYEFGNRRSITATGQTAKALLALVEAGPKGVTAFEAVTWAYRLAAYCHDLRRKHGLSVRTDKESHPGGWPDGTSSKAMSASKTMVPKAWPHDGPSIPSPERGVGTRLRPEPVDCDAG